MCLALVLAIIGIHASKLLHDAVPSSIRAGVSSGGGTMTWVLFLPFSLVFGWTAQQNGVHWSGFMLAGAVVVVGVLLVVSVRASRGVAPAEVAATAKEEAVEVAERAHELACKQLVELVADYLDDALSAEMRARFEEHLAGCDGCNTYLSQTQRIMADSETCQRCRTIPRFRRGGRSISGPGRYCARVDGIRWGDEPHPAWLERDFFDRGRAPAREQPPTDGK